LDETVSSAASGSAEVLGRGPGAQARLTAIGAGRRLDCHIHDAPYLSLHVLGSYQEEGDAGPAAIDGPAAAFHPAGSAHEDAIGTRGLATVLVEFDPDWLRRALGPWLPLDRSRYWIGGEAGRRAGRLARAWLGGAPVDRCFALTRAFLTEAAIAAPAPQGPSWLARLSDAADGDAPAVLADRLGVSRPWLFRAYRRHRGEGLEDMRRRRQVEAAVRLIETGALGLAEIAAETGFCDQSHMNRVFHRVLGRTPAAVRARSLGLAA
jgi:AraC family transcriptional regulator